MAQKGFEREKMKKGTKEKPVRILWISNHPITSTHHRELTRIFVRYTIDHDYKPIDKNDGHLDVAQRMRNAGGQAYDEIVIVTALSVIAGLIAMDISPIWPTMSEDGETFRGFDRITAVLRAKRLIDPNPSIRKILWVSNFAAVQSQRTELQRLFDRDVIVDHCRLTNDQEIAEEFRRGRYDTIVAVVPETVFVLLSDLNLPLMRSESIPETDSNKIEFRGAGGKGFRFSHFVWYSVTKVTTRL